MLEKDKKGKIRFAFSPNSKAGEEQNDGDLEQISERSQVNALESQNSQMNNTQNLFDSEEGENANQIYYDQEEIELNQEQQKKDQFEDLMRMKRNITVNSQNKTNNKFNIMDFLPKPKSSNGANSLSKRMKKALDDKIQREKKQGMMLD